MSARSIGVLCIACIVSVTLVAQETQCQFHAHPLVMVAIVADPHGLLRRQLPDILVGINQI